MLQLSFEFGKVYTHYFNHKKALSQHCVTLHCFCYGRVI